MILGFELTLFLYVVLAAVYRLCRKLGDRAALTMLVAAGAVLLVVANTVLATYLLAQVLWVLVLYWLCRQWESRAGQLPWLAFLGLLPLNFQIWAGSAFASSPSTASDTAAGSEIIFWTAGASFFVVKSFVALKEALREGRFPVLPTLAGLTFLPAFAAGPIFGSGPFHPSNIQHRLEVRAVIRGILQLGWGAAAFYVIAPELRNAAGENIDNLAGDVVDMYLNFAALFFDFSGYTLMAIAVGTFFGVTLPPNFNRPYLATSIREFWQRWHMSLSWFISTYLFKPFVRSTGSPRKGIFLAFVCVGLWHEAMPGYLLWGIGHGAALSLAMKPPQQWTRFLAMLPGWAGIGLCWFLTMTWVALLSSLASSAYLR